MKVILKNVRLSFPSLFKTEIFNGQDTEKYTASFLMEKGSKNEKAVKKAMKLVKEEKFGTGKVKNLGTPTKDGDDEDNSYIGYAGHTAIKGLTKRRPVLIDRAKAVITEADGIIYAGCRVNVSLDIYALENQFGKRISCQLNAIQFHSDDEPFVTGGFDEDDFEDESDDEGEAPKKKATKKKAKKSDDDDDVPF